MSKSTVQILVKVYRTCQRPGLHNPNEKKLPGKWVIGRGVLIDTVVDILVEGHLKEGEHLSKSTVHVRDQVFIAKKVVPSFGGRLFIVINHLLVH